MLHATTEWHRCEAAFVERKYSRAHRWHFDGGAVVAASSSPAIVPLPYSELSGVDPEEAFVASPSSRHLLRSPSIAAERGFVVDTYVDETERVLARNEARRLAITEVTLPPGVRFLGAAPEAAAFAAMHHEAHDLYVIANSVRTIVRVESCVVSVRPCHTTRCGGPGRTVCARAQRRWTGWQCCCSSRRWRGVLLARAAAVWRNA